METEKLIGILEEYKGYKITGFYKGEIFFTLKYLDEYGKEHVEFILDKSENKDIKII